MQQETRVRNASRNVVFGMFLKGYQILLPFIMRTAIMYYMGDGYLGLNSLFGSVLWVLNLAELGVGSAMVYSMYQPIIDNDKEQICALLKLYQKYYRIIGLVIAVIGGILTPFIPYLVKSDMPEGVSIYAVYLLNLFCTCMSYWLLAYKNSLLTAHQRNDVASKVMLVTNTFQYAAQLVVVMTIGDYYIYLIVQIFTQIVTNLVTAYFANKMYPEYKAVGKLPKETVKKINNRIRDLFTMKVGQVIVSSADTIVISAFLGLAANAFYNNYYYVLTAVTGIMNVVFVSCTAGIGNSILMETEEKNYTDLKKLSFIIMWLAGMCSAVMLCLYQPFMRLWVTEKRMLPFAVVVCMVVYFFISQVNQILITYKDAAGIWHEDRFRPLVTALVNLVLNIILVQFIGIYGVILSTVISVLAVGMPWILHNLFTVLFKRNAWEYIRKLLYYTIVTTIVCTLTYLVAIQIPGVGILALILKAIVSVIASNLLMFVAYFKMGEFAEVKKLVIRVLKRQA